MFTSIYLRAKICQKQQISFKCWNDRSLKFCHSVAVYKTYTSKSRTFLVGELYWMNNNRHPAVLNVWEICTTTGFHSRLCDMFILPDRSFLFQYQCLYSDHCIYILDEYLMNNFYGFCVVENQIFYVFLETFLPRSPVLLNKSEFYLYIFQ